MWINRRGNVYGQDAASMPQHYSVAQIQELFQALEKINEDAGGWNMTIATLRTEHLDRLKKAESPKSHPGLS